MLGRPRATAPHDAGPPAGAELLRPAHRHELAERGDEIADQLGLLVRPWIRVLDERGVAALFEARRPPQDAGRLLGRVGGERLLTDLDTSPRRCTRLRCRHSWA